MIDFRYHLVSLVSVFIALAVGIVLGAGPLRGQIAEGLNSQVAALRVQKSQAETERDSAETGVKNRDTFSVAVMPTLVSQQLGGRTVVLVTLPGSDGDAVKPLITTLQTAGARVTGRIDIKDGWTSTDTAAARQKLADQWKGALPEETSGGAGASPAPSSSSVLPLAGSQAPSPQPSASAGPAGALLEAELARALVTKDLALAEQTDVTGRAILDTFAKEGLLNVNGDLSGRATSVVILVPGVEQATVAAAVATPTPSPALSPSPTRNDNPTWTAMALALDRAGDGAVVVGPASADTSGGVIDAVRGSDAVKEVSTVDTGSAPMGDITTVFALREQLSGAAGAYGFGKGATSPLPEQGTS